MKLRFWTNVLIITVLVSVSVMIWLGKNLYDYRPPIPEKVVDSRGTVLSSERDIKGGQAVFQKYGLMNYGSIFGHGAYLGPDFTAEYLHLFGAKQRDFYARDLYGRTYDGLDADQRAAVDARTANGQKVNRYDDAAKTLTLDPAQTFAYWELRRHYIDLFSSGSPEHGLPANFISDAHIPEGGGPWLSAKPQGEQLSDFFFWTAWVSVANRPGANYSYTNNWPSDATVGNVPTRDSLVWSNISVGILLAGLGLILFLYRWWNLDEDEEPEKYQIPRVSSLQISPSQVKTGKYFVVVAALFLVQSLLGALSAHYFVEKGFLGFPTQDFLPFNIARTWHLQLAIFWIATAWLGTGLFISPLVGGREPKGQGVLVDILFWAVVAVAVGSLAGEWLGIKGYLGRFWQLFGTQGWEYVELGRVWQILLLVGMGLWLYIVYRALRNKLDEDTDRGSLSHLLFYAAVSIPVFYLFGLFYNPSTNWTVADYWRWFVVHIWVEGIFEFFAVVTISYLLVNMGLVREKVATRAVYFTLILIFGSGLIGIGHHFYWIGASAVWMAMGAVFSALEVVPLTLLISHEALHQYRMMKKAGSSFEYRIPLLFLIATAFWNFVGAGILGFITNMPIISYFEHGTYLTPTHGHGALMGVYGMLAIGLMLFSLRGIVKPAVWPERLLGYSFWLLNGGLALMLALNLLPVGFVQLAASYDRGFWWARSLEFISSPLIRTLTWLRLIGDLAFIAGALVLVWAVVMAVMNLRRADVAETDPSRERGRARAKPKTAH